MDFDGAFDRLMGHEGGYTTGIDDPGGETKWGISKRTYPTLDIKNLSRDDAKAIYLRDFWTPLDGLPESVTFQLFDFAVNSGIQTAIRKLQSAIGVADDGHFGPTSKAKAATFTETDLIMRLLAERLDFMTKLSNWDHNSRGWARRIAQNLRYGATDA